MLSKRGEQQGPIILDPEVTTLLHKLAQTFLEIAYITRWLQVFLVEPFLVPAAHGRVNDSTFVLHPQKQVDSGLLVRICVVVKVNEQGVEISMIVGFFLPSNEFV